MIGMLHEKEEEGIDMQWLNIKENHTTSPLCMMETPIREKLSHLQTHEIVISRREIVGYFDVKSFKGWFNIFSYDAKGWIQGKT